MKIAWKSETTLAGDDRVTLVQFTCLLAVVLMELAFFVLEDRASGVAYLLVEQYLTLPAMAFLGASFCRTLPRRNKWYLYGGLAMVALFFLEQFLHQVLESEAKQVGTFVCVYALCFPFAAATEDAQRQRGLKWMAGLFLAVGALLTLYAGLLLFDAVPDYLRSYVTWDGTRFCAMGHPNICATLLMISLALSAGLALQSRKLWIKGALLVLTATQFGAMALTNGRTTIILTCLLLGGLTFCALRGRGWKRVIPALLAAVVVIAALFCLSRAVYGWNQDRLATRTLSSSAPVTEESQTMYGWNQDRLAIRTLSSSAPVTEESQTVYGWNQDRLDTLTLSSSAPAIEESQTVVNRQGTLTDDMKTLNGRTVIWGYALEGLSDNSRIKFIGTEYVEMILARYASGTLYHTHNSWLEVLYRMGLPGLAAALFITALAVWSAAVVLWRNTELWKSCIALLTLCLLGCALLEPYLFVADVSYHYLDLLFLMCLGYLCLWRGEKVGGSREALE